MNRRHFRMSALWAIGGSAAAISGFQRPGPAGPIPPGTTRYVLNLPAGFPMPQFAPDNIPTVEGVALGKRLFEDPRLSGNNTQACASCHTPAKGFSDSPNALSVGIDKLKGTRNSMALFNLGYANRFFWDGRAPSLRAQALQPIQNPVEMHADLTKVVAKLKSDATYPGQFAKAFGSPGVDSNRLGLAIEQFLMTVISADSKFEQSQRGIVTLSAQEQRGAQLFRTPFDPKNGLFGAGCVRCHGGPLFTDFQFRNDGLEANAVDIGLQGVTGNAADRGKFKTPSLRNLAVTGPYMHDGRFATLDQVVAHYSNGIVASPTLDPGLARQNGGVKLSAADQAALVAFLKTLTDPKYSAATRATP